MSSWRCLRFVLAGWSGLALLATAGCIPIPFVYPSFTYVPALPTHTDEPVYVSRETKFHGGQTILASGYIRMGGDLDLVSVAEKHPTEPQSDFYWNHGLIWWPFYSYSDGQSTVFRFYRPGHETIELRGGPWHEELRWVKATTLDAQEKALDEIRSEGNDNWESDPSRTIRARQISERARAFLAGEYERLAALQHQVLEPGKTTDVDGVQRLHRLRQKANWLREQSEQKQ